MFLSVIIRGSDGPNNCFQNKSKYVKHAPQAFRKEGNLLWILHRNITLSSTKGIQLQGNQLERAKENFF